MHQILPKIVNLDLIFCVLKQIVNSLQIVLYIWTNYFYKNEQITRRSQRIGVNAK
jgi:hypothetical protein